MNTPAFLCPALCGLSVAPSVITLVGLVTVAILLDMRLCLWLEEVLRLDVSGCEAGLIYCCCFYLVLSRLRRMRCECERVAAIPKAAELP